VLLVDSVSTVLCEPAISVGRHFTSKSQNRIHAAASSRPCG
jgi:hypothetical protein